MDGSDNNTKIECEYKRNVIIMKFKYRVRHYLKNSEPTIDNEIDTEINVPTDQSNKDNNLYMVNNLFENTKKIIEQYNTM